MKAQNYRLKFMERLVKDRKKYVKKNVNKHVMAIE